MNEQIFIGVVVAILCGLGLSYDRWLLTSTKNGQWLIRRLGPDRGLLALRLLLAGGFLFGVLLALDVIRPMRW